MATFPPVPWTRNDEKLFEQALIQLPLEGSPFFPENISQLLQKPIEEVKYYCDALVSQLLQKPIESGEVALPKYPKADYLPITEAQIPKRKEPKKKRGTPWTKEEHELFLVGLQKFGKGDWKGISRECVKTRTSIQVASHAQKYFLRQNSDSKKRKRSSIHDITLKYDGDDVTNVPDGSNLGSMNKQQQYFVEEYPPEWFYGHDQMANMFDEASNASLLL